MSRAARLLALLVLTATPLSQAHALRGHAAPERAPPKPRAPPPSLSDEYREVEENLELLQVMDEAEDLELLLELSEQDSNDERLARASTRERSLSTEQTGRCCHHLPAYPFTTPQERG